MTLINNPSLEGSTVIVTGCAQGIGLGIAECFMRAGANVLGVDINSEKLDHLRKSHFAEADKKFKTIAADITSSKDCAKVIDQVVSSFGGIDFIINCAAPSRNRDTVKSLDLEDWDSHQKIMIETPILLASLASDYLSKSTNAAIVNISSILGRSIAQEQASFSYHVAKSALEQSTRWLAVRFGGLGIRVNAIAPGLVDREGGSKISENPKFNNLIKDITPLKRAGTYQDISNAVAFLCSTNSSYITGQVIVVDGGLSILEIFSAAAKAIEKNNERSTFTAVNK